MENKAGPTTFVFNWRELVHSLWRRILHARTRLPRSLRLCESLSLGERRFLAVVECEGSRFLVGGTASSLAMLTRLDDGTGREHFFQNDRLSREEDAG